MFIGIDPGKEGAVAKLNDDGSYHSSLDLALEVILTDKDKAECDKARTAIQKKNKEKKLRLNTHLDSASLLREIGTNNNIMVEKVATKQTDGHVGAFTFGKIFGAIISVCRVSESNSLSLVSPAVWQKYFDVTIKKEEKEGKTPHKIKKEHKEKIAAKAVEIYPEAKSDLYTPRGRLLDGRADAILIARYLYEKSVDNK